MSQKLSVHLAGAASAIAMIIVAVAALTFFATHNSPNRHHWGETPPRALTERGSPSSLQLPEPQTIEPFTPQQARAVNEALPFSGDALERPAPFNIGDEFSDPTAYNRALDCLTAAIYYEAAGQGDQGERAIAQVVLNRVRHPAFPARVCDVVYQGADRATGCQFTFTCDGSLLRKPNATGWAHARTIAKSFLDGAVEPSVGMATHYHADWVVPRWAPHLDKIARVNSQIFYRWPGLWGRRASFRQLYAGELASATPIAMSAHDAFQAETVEAPASISLPERAILSPVLRSDSKSTTLAEDEPSRKLLADDQAPSLIADGREHKLALDHRPES